MENRSEDSFHTVFSEELEGLSELVKDFCESEYSGEYDFHDVFVQRSHPDDHVWKVHEFPDFDSRAVRGINHHLKARRDVVRLRIGTGERVDLEVLICKARNSNVLVRYLSQEEIDGLDKDDLVIVSVNKSDMGKAKSFVEKVEPSGK